MPQMLWNSHTSLAEEVLQILPSNIEGELFFPRQQNSHRTGQEMDEEQTLDT
jgi:hypothetical protein